MSIIAFLLPFSLNLGRHFFQRLARINNKRNGDAAFSWLNFNFGNASNLVTNRCAVHKAEISTL